MIILFIFLSLQLSAFANDGDREIYKALLSEELNITPEGLLGVAIYRKEVGGLVCDKRLVVHPGAKPSYRCAIKEGEADHEDIYNTLSTLPDSLDGTKKIGRLSCLKSDHNDGSESYLNYVCSLLAVTSPPPIRYGDQKKVRKAD